MTVIGLAVGFASMPKPAVMPFGAALAQPLARVSGGGEIVRPAPQRGLAPSVRLTQT